MTERIKDYLLSKLLSEKAKREELTERIQEVVLKGGYRVSNLKVPRGRLQKLVARQLRIPLSAKFIRVINRALKALGVTVVRSSGHEYYRGLETDEVRRAHDQKPPVQSRVGTHYKNDPLLMPVYVRLSEVEYRELDRAWGKSAAESRPAFVRELLRKYLGL